MKLVTIAALILAFLQVRPSPTGIIEGVVTGTDGRTPLSGVRIQIEDAFPSSQIRRPFTAETTTDRGGRFAVRDIPAGEFAVNASLEGYLVRVAGIPVGRPETKVSLDAGQRAQVSLALTAASTIRGRITNSEEHPVASADVRILQQYVKEDGRRDWRGLEYRGQTNENGEYRISLVAPGDYYVRTEQEIDGIREFAYFPGTSHPDGALAFSVREGAETIADIRIQPAVQARTFKVSGRLVHSFKDGVRTLDDISAQFPPPGVTLRERSRSLLGERTVRGIVDPDTGRFEIMGVPPGAYDLLATIAVGEERYFSWVAIDVHDDDVEDVMVNVVPGVDVRARIVVDGDTQNQSAPNVQVYLQSEDFPYNPARVVDESGILVTFPNVSNGTYRISAGIEPSGTRVNPDFYVDDVRIAGRSVYDTGIRVGVDPVDSVEVVIGTRGGTLEGTIQGNGKTAAAVILLPDSFRRSNPALYKREVIPATDEKGTVRLRGVAPGNYKIFAVPDTAEGVPFRSPEFAARYESRAVPVTVQKGATVGPIPIPLLER